MQQVSPPEATPSPPDWFHRFAEEMRSGLSMLHNRVTDLETLATPVEQVAEAIDPGAKPIIDQVHEVRSFLADLVNAFHDHFGAGKINLPVPPTGLK